MKYIAVEDIDNYKKLFNKEILSNEDLVNMVNWFAEGAVTSVSNEIYELMTEKDCDKMERAISQDCRCFSCYVWQFTDENGNVIKEVESLTELVRPRGHK